MNRNNGGVFTAEVDTSPPFQSVMEAVNRFGGGVNFVKPHTLHNPCSQIVDKKVCAVTEKSETLEILKEFEATKARFEELKVKLEKQLATINTYPCDENNTHVDDESKTDILKQVEETKQVVKNCKMVLEEALSASSEFKNNDYNRKNSNSNTNTMSIGQILKRKLVLAEEEKSNKTCLRWKTSLAHILSKATKAEKRSGGGSSGGGSGVGVDGGGDQGIPAKRMRFGFCV